METSLLAVILAALTLVTMLAKEFFSWRGRAREEEKQKQAQLATEQKIAENVYNRITQQLRNENSTVIDHENRMDEALKKARQVPGG